jgi:hypothetical protein
VTEKIVAVYNLISFWSSRLVSDFELGCTFVRVIYNLHENHTVAGLLYSSSDKLLLFVKRGWAVTIAAFCSGSQIIVSQWIVPESFLCLARIVVVLLIVITMPAVGLM